MPASSVADQRRPDPLLTQAAPPERPYYANGVLLDASDFTAEQTYHRGRLARALAYLHGDGTVAGLEVKRSAPADPAQVELIVQPGLAIDRSGRLIEIERPYCLRLDDWFLAQAAKPALRGGPDGAARLRALAQTPAGIVADVFIRFVACARGYTPAFGSGPFDALDAVQPSRVRDGYAVELLLRTDDIAADLRNKLPADPWGAVLAQPEGDARRAALRTAMLAGWREGSAATESGSVAPGAEHMAGQDATSVFLARVAIATDPPPAADRPPLPRWGDLAIHNEWRAFVLPTNLLARAAGLIG